MLKGETEKMIDNTNNNEPQYDICIMEQGDMADSDYWFNIYKDDEADWDAYISIFCNTLEDMTKAEEALGFKKVVNIFGENPGKYTLKRGCYCVEFKGNQMIINSECGTELHRMVVR